ncbi:hypothetical protein HCN44_003902 [Aphidius gifuensis]|uniref:Uncharacterized protein n=2 Tax=Aphidius gifuensis TaxID=684658 RepID=A0A835CVJ0_APHGI|nr:hypothetical protein HCN44_003902 [Aphidius gifuensis]
MMSTDRYGNPRPMPVDIVDKLIGSGRWQLLLTVLLSFCTFTHMLNTGTEALMRPDGWWCKKPTFLNNWTNAQWISYSHSSDSCVGVCNRNLWDHQVLADGHFQGCEIYDIDYKILIDVNYNDRPPMTTNKKITCPYGIYYSSLGGQSLAQKFNRGCLDGKVMSNMWQSSSTFGRIIGYIFMGILGDWIGRKPVILISCGLAPITALIVALSNTYSLFVVSSLINGFFDGGFSLPLVLIMEISTNEHRSGLLVIGCCCFALGIGLTPSINNLFHSYDLMVVLLNTTLLAIFPFKNIIPESPSWLFCKNKLPELKSISLLSSKMNKKKVTNYDNYRIIYYGPERHKLPKKKLNLWNLLFEPETACEIMGLIYLTGLFALIFGSSYYSILANVTKSQLANYLLAISTMIGTSTGQFCLLLMGHRKILLISILMLLISSLMLLIDFHNDKVSDTGPIATFLLINIAVVSLSYGVLLNYNTRTVPTLLRGSLSGILRGTWGLFVWIGNHDYVKFPTTAFGIIMACVLATLFCLNIQDLYHRELPDTMSDSINFRL